MAKSRFVTEKALKVVVDSVMKVLTKHAKNSISISSLQRRIKKLESKVEQSATQEFTRTTKFDQFYTDIYIPIGATDDDLGCTVDISFGVKSGGSVIDAVNYAFGLVIPPRYRQENVISPICSYISETLHKPNLYAFISLDEIVAVDGEEPMKFIRISFDADTDDGMSDSLNNCNYLDVTVFSQEQNVEVLSSTTIFTMNRLKSHDVLAGVFTSVPDIANHEQLLRSESVDFVEVKTKDEYKALEAGGGLNSRTMYNIPEEA